MPSMHSISTFAKLLVPTLFALSSLSSASAQNEISGKYCGLLWSGGQLVEVETALTTQLTACLSAPMNSRTKVR